MSRSANALTVVRRRGTPEDPTLPAILEFQWPSTAIINAPIPRSARGITWMIFSLVAAMIAVTGIIKVDQVVTVKGVVVSKAPTILVQPLDTAIVRSIDVHEGQQVHAGDILARLDPTFATADLGAVAAQVSSLEAEVARLQAEADGKPFDYTAHGPDWAVQGDIYEHRKAQYAAKIDGYVRKLDELTAVISRSQSDADGYKQRLALAQSVEEMRTQLQAAQVGSRLNTIAAMDSRAELARSLANAQQTAEVSQRDYSAMVAERDGFIQGWQADVSQKLLEATRRLSDEREQLNKAKLHRALVELRAESDATVQSVAKVSVGSVMHSGEQFITLVPADAPLEIEANIFGTDNGFVQVGNQVAVKFDTFPYSQYGMAEGTVRIVSPNSFSAMEEARNPTSAVPVPNTGEPFYRARIAIDRVALRNVPAGFHLIPGMPVTADIKIGRRTVLRYFLGRVMPLAQEGMREP